MIMCHNNNHIQNPLDVRVVILFGEQREYTIANGYETSEIKNVISLKIRLVSIRCGT